MRIWADIFGGLCQSDFKFLFRILEEGTLTKAFGKVKPKHNAKQMQKKL